MHTERWLHHVCQLQNNFISISEFNYWYVGFEKFAQLGLKFNSKATKTWEYSKTSVVNFSFPYHRKPLYLWFHKENRLKHITWCQLRFFLVDFCENEKLCKYKKWLVFLNWNGIYCKIHTWITIFVKLMVDLSQSFNIRPACHWMINHR